jgi:hypothetical protein
MSWTPKNLCHWFPSIICATGGWGPRWIHCFDCHLPSPSLLVSLIPEVPYWESQFTSGYLLHPNLWRHGHCILEPHRTLYMGCLRVCRWIRSGKIINTTVAHVLMSTFDFYNQEKMKERRNWLEFIQCRMSPCSLMAAWLTHHSPIS